MVGSSLYRCFARYCARFNLGWWPLKGLLGIMLLAMFDGAYASAINMPIGVTPMSHDIYAIHMVAFWVSVAICIFVFGWMAWNFVAYRRSKGAESKNIHEHLGVEILWTVIPAALLIVMAIPATKVLIKIHDTANPDMSVKVIGYQWKWRYQYLDQGIDFFSNLSTTQDQINNKEKKGKWFLLEVDRPMVVPVGKKIRLLVTAADVIHDWWVPDLGVKQDAIPGYINENWIKIDKVGTYRGECGELCGLNHGFMPIVVKAVTQPDFEKWVAGQKKVGESAAGGSAPVKLAKMTEDQLLDKGKKVYGIHCAACHQTSGAGIPPTFPALKGGAITVGPLAGHLHIVLYGKQGTTMQAFKEQLSAEEIAAVVTYERSAWGNEEINKKKKHVVVVQPAEVAKLLQDKKEGA